MKYYDIYDGDTLYLKCVSRNEINRIFNVNRASLTQYIDNDWKLNGQYTVVENKEHGFVDVSAFTQEWEEAIKPFKRVIWCKNEGKQLYAKSGAR